MKAFFFMPDHEFTYVGKRYRESGMQAPDQSHANDLKSLKFRMPIYDADIVVAATELKTDEVIKFFKNEFPNLQVLWYTFDRQAIKSSLWEWYRDETLRQFRKRNAVAA